MSDSPSTLPSEATPAAGTQKPALPGKMAPGTEAWREARRVKKAPRDLTWRDENGNVVERRPAAEANVETPAPATPQAQPAPPTGLSPWIVSILVGILGLGLGWFLGATTSRPATASMEKTTFPVWTDDQQAVLERALTAKAEGSPDKAFEQLAGLLATTPDLPSLRYVAALCAAESGNEPTARELLDDAIAAGQRLSDALALRGALDRSLSATLTARSDYLRQAIAADPMNPNPLFELATVLRKERRTKEALAMFDAVQRRMLPTDSQMVVAVTSELVRLESLSTTELPEAPTLTNPFSTAYVLLRKEDAQAASRVLAGARNLVSPDTFAFILGDAAFAAYRGEPEIAAVLP